MASKVGRGSDQFPLRLPEGLREWIKRHADFNSRSMNSEIVELIVRSLNSAELERIKGGLEPLREMTATERELLDDVIATKALGITRKKVIVVDEPLSDAPPNLDLGMEVVTPQLNATIEVLTREIAARFAEELEKRLAEAQK